MIFATDAFAGRTILVTGASSGIGRAAAVELSRCGARIAALGRSEKRLQQTLEFLSGAGHTIHPADISSADGATEAVHAIASSIGPLDGILHSAGTSVIMPIKLTKKKHIDEVFGAGYFGAFGVARAAAKKNVMMDGGSLVFMSSVAAARGRAGMASYSAAKAAVDGMVRVCAAELGPRKIRVNSILAGAVETEMHRGFVDSMSESTVKDYEDLHILGFGSPSDVAYAALFLLSDASSWITGSGMAVDGGYMAK